MGHDGSKGFMGSYRRQSSDAYAGPYSQLRYEGYDGSECHQGSDGHQNCDSYDGFYLINMVDHCGSYSPPTAIMAPVIISV